MPASATDLTSQASAAAGGGSPALRSFGRLQLLRLLGKSERTMAWLAADPDSGRDLLLVLPRSLPGAAGALRRWRSTLQRGTRLAHPQLAQALDIGVQDGWPYATYDASGMATLAERLTARGLPGPQAAMLCTQVLRGLAFAHDAGMAHHDLQPYLLLVDDLGQLKIAGFGVGSEDSMAVAREGAGSGDAVVDVHASLPGQGPAGLIPRHREAAECDVLALGLLLHAVLAGQPALDEPDIGRAARALPPSGRDVVRLPWTLAQPVADPLRAIVNRATERQPRQRYHSARTMLRALEGWLQAEAAGGGGPLALLGDKLRAAGVLPLAPGAARRAARLASMQDKRTSSLAEVVLGDPALSFELLRAANAAQVRSGLMGGSGPVLSVRRAIALLGELGLQRAASALRPWPGPLEPSAADALQQQLQHCQRAARAAVALRPPGYDGEVVHLVAMIQNLGRLVLLYHFPEESQQIRRLMQPEPAPLPGEPDEPGMSEAAACFAVMGTDVESLGAAVLRHWGLGEALGAMLRRLPVAGPVRHPESDEDLLRTLGSCANEAADALQVGGDGALAALQRVAQRYGRALGIDLAMVRDALLLPSGGAHAPEPDMQLPMHGLRHQTAAALARGAPA